MVHEVSLADVHPLTSDTFGRFLQLVQERTKEDVHMFLLDLIETAENASDSKNNSLKQLADALEDDNVVEVWKLIAKRNEDENNQTLENLNEVCRIVAGKESNKENGSHFKCSWNCKKLCKTIKNSLCYMLSWISQCDEGLDDLQEEAEMRSEKERKWIEILSNPLYISLEWLWRNNPNQSQFKKGIRRKESKFVDIIEAALDDAYLLEKIASYEHYYSRDDYERRAEEYETFAADIVEQVDTSDLNQLHEIMDIEGNGSLLNKAPANFNQSLSLLKLAANKQRKRFVASPKCQYILNEIIYRGWRNWQDKGILRKSSWFLIQFVLVAITCFVYIPIRLLRRCCGCGKVDDSHCWKFRKLYELPYSKFINHTMSYVLFLCLVFASSFQDKFGTTKTGLAWIDYPVLAFVVGLFMQEALEATRQGFLNYFSKWWNVVDTMIVFTFLLSYTVWLSAWGYYGEWKPRKSAFIVADAIYASATVMAFFHLAHVFQINSVLGPLQLSLYKMLKDVLKFLVIFLLLYIAFATGVAKIYSYYVASQIKLEEFNDSHGYKPSHPYGKHTSTFIGMFWLLLGLVEEDKIVVEDPAFKLSSSLGRTFMAAHVVCTVIVALNMLIAMMNNSFEKIMENALVEWKFSRTRMWLEWIDKGNTVPVPFNIVYLLLYCLCPKSWGERFCGNERPNDPEQSTLHLQVFPCCCSRCICSCGICKSTFGCTCCSRVKHSMREERMEEMGNLIVKYLKDRYSARWKEFTAKTAAHQTISENI